MIYCSKKGIIMNEFKALRRPALVVGVLFLSAAAYAQALDPNAPPPPAAPGLDRPMRPMPPMPPLPGERIEAELAYLKTALKLSQAQTAGWERVADVLRAQARRRDDEIRARRAAYEKNRKNTINAVDSSLIDGLEYIQREKSAESDDLVKLLAVLKPFYAMLTNQQRAIADQTICPGPGGPHAFGALGMGLPVYFKGPIGPPPFEGDCQPGPG
jgi:hypothetical protein